jgi:uncharacterized Tic20 family protein
MGKICAFVIGTTVISLLLLVPLVYMFELISDLMTKIGSIDSIASIWQGLIWIAFALVLAVATLMALLLWEVR